MSGLQAPKKHHFVPECYLKNFLKGGKFYALDIRKVQSGLNEFPRVSQPGGICYLEDYYRIDQPTKRGNFNLEAFDALYIESTVLRNLDEKYHAIYEKLILGDPLPIQDATDLCDFMVLLKVRNPYWLTKVIEKNKDSWIDDSIDKIFEKRLNENYPFKHIPEEIQKMVFDHVRGSTKENPSFSKEMQLFGIIQRHLDESSRNLELRKNLVDSSWSIILAPEGGPYFVTTDNPGFSIGKDGQTYNTKFTQGFFYQLPLSPIHCLIIGDEWKENTLTEKHSYKTITLGRVDSSMVIRLNDNAIRVANKLLIGVDTWYLSQIAKVNKPNRS
jgi:hypothetical protein